MPSSTDLQKLDVALQVVCHGIPDKRPLQNGDIINVDVTAFYRGFHGDLNETYVVGEVDAASKKLLKITYEVRGKTCHVQGGTCMLPALLSLVSHQHSLAALQPFSMFEPQRSSKLLTKSLCTSSVGRSGLLAGSACTHLAQEDW